MASSLSLGIHIGAAMDASVGNAFNNVSRQAQQLGERLSRIRMGREAAASVQALSTELQQLQARQAAAGGSDAALAAEINRVETELNQARAAAQRLGLELTDLNGETNRLTQSEARLQRQLQRQQQLDTNRNRRSELMGETMGVLALGAALALPIKSAMEFEAKMSELGAVTNESTAAMEKQARQLGRDTSFDAKGAADAQIALAKAGLDNQKIQAATPVVLSIAAASMMSLGQTAEITADIMGGYSMKMTEIGKVSDVLVKTANLSTTSVAELGESLKYVGGVASAVNVSFEQTNAMLGILSNVGIKGSQAGTSMRMAFLRLASSPKKAREALEELGVVVKDAKGNFRDMPTILKELDQSMAKMGNGEKIGNYGAIFGAESATAMLALGKAANNGELDAFTEKLKNSAGAAKEVADKMQANTKGAMERMMSSFSELGLVIGNVLLPSVTRAADGLGAFINDVSVAGEKFPLVTAFIVKGAGALLVFKVASIGARFGMTLLSDAVVFGKAAFDFFRLSTMRANIAIVGHTVASTALAIQQKTLAAGTAIATAAQWLWNAAMTANPIGLVIIAVAALAFAVVKYWEPIKAFTLGMWDGLKIGLAPVMESLAPLQPLFSAIGSAIGGLIGWIGQLFMPLNATKEELASSAEAGRQFCMVLGSSITALISVVGTLAQAFMIIGTGIGQAVAIGVGYLNQLQAAAVSLVSGFFTIGSQIMDGLLGGLSAGYAKVKAQVLSMGASIASTFKSTLGIHSPSRVFAEFGNFINQGLQIGLAESKGEPIGESLKIAGAIANGFDANLSNLSTPSVDIGTARPAQSQGIEAVIGKSINDRLKMEDVIARGFEVNPASFDGGAAKPTQSQGVAAESPLTISITINQLAGENSEDLANRIIAKIEQRQQLARRGKLHD